MVRKLEPSCVLSPGGPLKGQLGVNVSRPNGSRKVQGPEGADPILDPQEIQLLPMFTTRTPGGLPRQIRFSFAHRGIFAETINCGKSTWFMTWRISSQVVG